MKKKFHIKNLKKKRNKYKAKASTLWDIINEKSRQNLLKATASIKKNNS